MVLAAGAASSWQQIGIDPFVQLRMAVRECESGGIAVIDGRPVVDGIGEEVEITVVDAFRIFVQEHEGIRRADAAGDIRILVEDR